MNGEQLVIVWESEHHEVDPDRPGETRLVNMLISAVGVDMPPGGQNARRLGSVLIPPGSHICGISGVEVPGRDNPQGDHYPGIMDMTIGVGDGSIVRRFHKVPADRLLDAATAPEYAGLNIRLVEDLR
jgi:hypothetical protein